MKIHIIAVNNANGEAWVVSAWDEYSIEENPSGFDEDFEKQKEKHKDSDVRVGIVEVPESFFGKLFDVPVVKGVLVEEKEGSS